MDNYNPNKDKLEMDNIFDDAEEKLKKGELSESAFQDLIAPTSFSSEQSKEFATDREALVRHDVWCNRSEQLAQLKEQLTRDEQAVNYVPKKTQAEVIKAMTPAEHKAYEEAMNKAEPKEELKEGLSEKEKIKEEFINSPEE